MGKREPENDLKTKPILKKHKEKSEEKETTEGFADSRVELSETMSDQANLISEEEVAARKRKETLFVANLSRETKISDFIDFFHNVGGVVCITLVVNRKGSHCRFGFVDFASANEAKKALEMKNGEYLHGHKIYVDKARATNHPKPKYCIDHKVFDNPGSKTTLDKKSLLIEENETVLEGHDEDTGSVKEVAIRKKTLFVADLSPQTKTIDVSKFFHDVGQVVSLRLIVNHEGKHVGCGLKNKIYESSKYKAAILNEIKKMKQMEQLGKKSTTIHND